MSNKHQLSRREFTLALASALVGTTTASRQRLGQGELDEFILEMLERDRAPGFAAAVAVRDRLVWSGAYGLADVYRDIAMTPTTIQNIGSISKTLTATAVMQQWEAGRFRLDDDVCDYLPYCVRNPRYPDTPITFRQLLAHRSSVKDGPAYGESYACADPAVSLGVWIEQYLTPGGEYYNPAENFHEWAPGTADPPARPRAYTNVGYGLLGYLVEQLTGAPFHDYCREHIFAPLGMNETGWLLSEIDSSRHAVPYSLLPDDFEPPEGGTESLLPAANLTEEMLTPGSYLPHCLYSFFNYPDGLVRTSVDELSHFLLAYMNGGTLGTAQILEPATIELMLSRKHFGRGLCWGTRELRNGDLLWGHGGGDPGIATYMGFRQRDNVGVIMFYNYDTPGDGAEEILERLFVEGARRT